MYRVVSNFYALTVNYDYYRDQVINNAFMKVSIPTNVDLPSSDCHYYFNEYLDLIGYDTPTDTYTPSPREFCDSAQQAYLQEIQNRYSSLFIKTTNI